jgi:hypothetical protein
MLAENVNRALAGLQGKALGHQKMALESTLRLHNDVAARRVSAGNESGLHAETERPGVLGIWLKRMVGPSGFEPLASWSRTRRQTLLNSVELCEFSLILIESDADCLLNSVEIC